MMTLPQWSARFGTIGLLAAAIFLVLGACGGGSPEEFIAGPGDLGHIHDLALRDDGILLVASHSGLYQVEDERRAVRIGVHHDLMSMTVLPDGDLLASGHPNLLLEEFRVEDRPPFLGLARSTDGGENWDELELLGEADFHALVPTDAGLYAAETSGNIWFQDPNSGWSTLGAVDARDLALDPSDAQRQLAPDYDGMVWYSVDGAMPDRGPRSRQRQPMSRPFTSTIPGRGGYQSMAARSREPMIRVTRGPRSTARPTEAVSYRG